MGVIYARAIRSITHAQLSWISVFRADCFEKREFLCMMKIWISEQSLCTLIDIQNQCGEDAPEFYTDLQQNVFDRNFPIICDIADNITPANNNSYVNNSVVVSSTFPSPLAPPPIRPMVTEIPRILPPTTTTEIPSTFFPYVPTRSIYPQVFTSRPFVFNTNRTNGFFFPTTTHRYFPWIPPRPSSSVDIFPPAPQFPPSGFRPGTWNALGSGSFVPFTTTQSYFYGPETTVGTTRWLPWYLQGSKSQGRQSTSRILWPNWTRWTPATSRPVPLLIAKKSELSQEYNNEYVGGTPTADRRVADYQWFRSNSAVSLNLIGLGNYEYSVLTSCVIHFLLRFRVI